MKKAAIFVLALVLVMVSGSLVFAAEQAAGKGGSDYGKIIFFACTVIAAGLAMGLGSVGTGVGMGHGLSGATNAVGRNPEAQGKILLTMMVGLAMIESLAIYALVIALVLLYANPLIKFLG